MPKFKEFHKFQKPLVGLCNESFLDYAEAVKDPNDMNQLEPMIENAENNTKIAVDEVAADSGYGTIRLTSI